MAAQVQVLSIVAGSTQPSLTLTVTNISNNTAFDLTGYTVQMDISLGSSVLTKTATVSAPTTGVALFTWATTDLTVAGQYDAQLTLTAPSSTDVWKIGGIMIDVVASVR